MCRPVVTNILNVCMYTLMVKQTVNQVDKCCIMQFYNQNH